MDIIKAIQTRSSIRNFAKEEVNSDEIKEMIRLAGLAPSINNYQPWQYFVVTNKDLLANMAKEVALSISKLPESSSRLSKHIKNQLTWYSTFFQEAPALIALAARKYESDMEKGSTLTKDQLDEINNFPDLQSAGASVQNLLLAATSMGYGTCWMSGPLHAKDKLEMLLGIANPWSLVTFVAIGKPGEPSPAKTKRDLSQEIIWKS